MSRLRLLLPEAGLKRWHRLLAERLIDDGHSVAVALRPPRGAPPPSTALIEALEDLLNRGRRPSACEAEAPGAWSAADDGDADLTFDLTGSAETEAGAIVPHFDGAPGDGACDAALIAGRAPWIELIVPNDAAALACADALPALPGGRRLIAGRAAVANVLSSLVRHVAANGASETRPVRARAIAPAPTQFGAATALLSGLIARRLRQLVVHDGHWRIGLRRRSGEDALMTGLNHIHSPIWRWLPDDRQRYFADPFLFEEGGVTYLFCEEFPYATGKGVISVSTLDEAGVPGPTRIVLEQPFHLSYPLVFRAEGEIWMMPESGGNRTLDLYRAEHFPDRWKLERTLIAGAELADATPFFHNGQWWLMAASGDLTGSTWDTLVLYSGGGPLGPWTPTSNGPALIDASAARPAGHIFTHEGALWRPAQDCRAGYGAGLALCRIDALGPGRFAQAPMLRFAPPGGMHTINATERFVAMDVAGPRARFAWAEGLAP
ncbi:MAG: hypothetical protein E7774_11190 [Bradyrhizobium sp.]|nr:MAG: hypothetical protein E7774_11190 [Bradyrhizobium sp.]